MPQKLIVTGIGTDVGKTIVSAILTHALNADYWKPVQCGEEQFSDSTQMADLTDPEFTQVHPSSYSLQAPLSPHHAARLANTLIESSRIVPPQTYRNLVIETAGGVYVPYSTKSLCFDIYKKWNCPWVVVSKHYLGSINHTLLTIDALKQHNISILGIVFNGYPNPNPDTESAITEITDLPVLGRLFPIEQLNRNIIKKYSIQWQPQLSQLLR